MTTKPSWEIFDKCETCMAEARKPCWNLRKSTTKNRVQTTYPHKGRPRFKKFPLYHSYKQTVRNYLTRNYEWEAERVKKWIYYNKAYLRAMWESACPSDQTAEYIANMKENKDE